MSALIAGLAGAFFAHSVGSLDSRRLQVHARREHTRLRRARGVRLLVRPPLGAGLLTSLPILIRDGLGASIRSLRNFAQLPDILTGLALMLVIIFMPGGLAAAFVPGRRLRPRGEPRRPGATAAFGSDEDIPPPDTDSKGEAECCLLELQRLGRSFGGVEALSDVSLQIREGGVYGLIGPNGAGKTTLMNLVTGLISPSSGRILWRGREMQAMAPHRIARLGIARTYQNIQLFPEMSALENVIVGHHIHVHTNLASTGCASLAIAARKRRPLGRPRPSSSAWVWTNSRCARPERSLTATSAARRSRGPWPSIPASSFSTSRRRG